MEVEDVKGMKDLQKIIIKKIIELEKNKVETSVSNIAKELNKNLSTISEYLTEMLGLGFVLKKDGKDKRKKLYFTNMLFNQDDLLLKNKKEDIFEKIIRELNVKRVFKKLFIKNKLLFEIKIGRTNNLNDLIKIDDIGLDIKYILITKINPEIIKTKLKELKNITYEVYNANKKELNNEVVFNDLVNFIKEKIENEEV